MGAAALGGAWKLAGPGDAIAPLTAAGMANYAGVLVNQNLGRREPSWHTADNWSPSGVPANGDDVVIGSTGANAPILNVNTSNLNSLTINASRTLTLSNNHLTVTGTGASAINLSASGATIAVGTGQIANSGGLSLASGAQITVAGGTVSATGGISNSGTITFERCQPHQHSDGNRHK